MKKKYSERKTVRAFTIVELLIVVAMIAILVGLLLPALNQVMEKGRSITCTSNIRQISLAVITYLDSHDAVFPPTTDSTAKSLFNYYLVPFFSQKEGSTSMYQRTCPTALNAAKNPATVIHHRVNADVFPFYSGGAWVDPAQNPGRMTRITRASRTFTFYCPLPDNTVLYTTMALRFRSGHAYCNMRQIHTGKTNAGFLDGHVESQNVASGQYLNVIYRNGASAATLWE